MDPRRSKQNAGGSGKWGRQNGQAREECVGDVNKRTTEDMKTNSSSERSTYFLFFFSSSAQGSRVEGPNIQTKMYRANDMESPAQQSYEP